jgi:iduronate 2-sulfatase
MIAHLIKRILKVGVLILITTILVYADAEPSTQKNVLLICCDDLNDDLGCYGHPVVKSPHIDDLANRGIKFNNARSNYALCNPSRTSFLSGLYPETTHIYDNSTRSRKFIGKDHLMLEEYFHKSGYFTARCGKIAHSKYSSEFAWDIDLDKAPHFKGADDGSDNENGDWSWQRLDCTDAETKDGAMADYICTLLKDWKNGNNEQAAGKPFFIAAGFHKPHTPWNVPKQYFEQYEDDLKNNRIKLPPELGEPQNDRDDIPPVALTTFNDYLKRTDDERREALRAYYASISFADAGVGKIIAQMDNLKLWKDTVVIFISDHGYHLGEHGGLAHKDTVFAESTRIPLIVVAPGITPDVCTKPISLVDLYPTLAELCGLQAPGEIQGLSFASLLSDPKNETLGRAAYSVIEHDLMGRSIETFHYRYTEWGDGTNIGELYDLETDPGEFTNLFYTSDDKLKSGLHQRLWSVKETANTPPTKK